MAITTSLLNITNGAALGVSPGAATTSQASDDVAGTVGLTAGASGTTTGALVAFDLGTSYSDPEGRAAPIVNLQAGNAATAGLGLYPTVTNGVHVVINCTVAPTASAVLAINYEIIT